MKKNSSLFSLLFSLFTLAALCGCGTLRKIWKSDDTQAAIAADVQRLAGTDKLAAQTDQLAARFDAVEERAQLSYAFTWLTAQKQGISETDARDFLEGKTQPAEEPVEEEPVPAEVDEGDFDSFKWAYGGKDCHGAKLDSPRLAKLRASSSSISYKWEKGLDGWGLAKEDAGALACLFVTRKDGSIIGGKFDWVSTSRASRGLENVFGGYNGWTLSDVPNPCTIYYVVVSADGRKRSNVVSCNWQR